MPAIHGSLTDKLFVDFHNIARSQGKDPKVLVGEIVASFVETETHKLSNQLQEKPE